MAGRIAVKICGLRSCADISTAAEAGARYVGFVFFRKSPRALTPDEARPLAETVPPGVAKVALVVDMDDTALDATVGTLPIDMIQLHGSETPDRVVEIRRRYGLPVMKAIGLARPADLDRIAKYEKVADQILVDAKPPEGGALPGGNGIAFDWRLIAGRTWTKPWMLAGGLTPDTVAEAARLTGAQQVDVSSGVERAPGVKDPDLIRAFLKAVA